MPLYLDLLPESLGDYDIRHLGMLLKLLRESRAVTAQQIADVCDVVRSTISHFERTGNSDGEIIQNYISALGKKGVVKQPHTPLSVDNVETLVNLARIYQGSRQNEREQMQHLYNLTLIDSNHLTEEPALQRLVEKLREEKRPALIADDLWFVHALNDHLLKFFGMDRTDELLKSWLGWHAIGTKIPRKSKVRLAHHSDVHFLATETFFFYNRQTSPYLFSPHMRMLIDRLCKESIEADSVFHSNLIQTIKMLPGASFAMVPRDTDYKGRIIGTTPRYEDRVVVERDGGFVTYSLHIWEPSGNGASEVFREIDEQVQQDLRDLQGSSHLLFLTDIDSKQEFHINNWPEMQAVKKRIQMWRRKR